ncbi:MAG: hypothetical protein OCD76_02375, partial [Reichenbachiella sp.]
MTPIKIVTQVFILLFITSALFGCSDFFGKSYLEKEEDRNILNDAQSKLENTQQNCTDGIDNDEDDKTDCVDEDCYSRFPSLCGENTLELCQDGLDNDDDLDTMVIIYSDTVRLEMLQMGNLVNYYNSTVKPDGAHFDTLIEISGEFASISTMDPHETLWELLKVREKVYLDTIHTGIDCSDTDCKLNFDVCGEFTQKKCTDSLDNDGDSYEVVYYSDSLYSIDSEELPDDFDVSNPITMNLDCTDKDCNTSFPDICGEKYFALCLDGIDNDGDNYVDCFDSDCFNNFPKICGEATEGFCKDGIDNDEDGKIDCDDVQCETTDICRVKGETTLAKCLDGIDNDEDGLIDCADPDCIEDQEEVCRKKEDSPYLCQDGEDNDEDGIIDCLDSDCSDFFACDSTFENSFQKCKDGLDNDEDGAIDCMDAGCALVTDDDDVLLCDLENSALTCDDGEDNDLNSLIDCDDSTCVAIFRVCEDPFKENTTIKCSDNIDNDNDKKLDCDDQNCKKFFHCTPKENDLNLCSNGIDDDDNGQIDCDDEGCKELPSCTKLENLDHLCSDKKDNDLDGEVDCADMDCKSTMACFKHEYTPEDCTDGADNDVDGYKDCWDIDCTSLSVCDTFENSPLKCQDGIDNDRNGKKDCDDMECLAFSICQEDMENTTALCQDTLDNDGDGMVDCADEDCLEAGVEHCINYESHVSPHNCHDGFDNDGDGKIDCADIGCSEVKDPNSNFSCGKIVDMTIDSIFALFKDDTDPSLTEWYNNNIRFNLNPDDNQIPEDKWMGLVQATPGWFKNDTALLGDDYASDFDPGEGYKVEMSLSRFNYGINPKKVVSYCPPDLFNASDSTCGEDDLSWEKTNPKELLLGNEGMSFKFATYTGYQYNMTYYKNGFLRFDIKSDFDMLLRINAADG